MICLCGLSHNRSITLSISSVVRPDSGNNIVSIFYIGRKNLLLYSATYSAWNLYLGIFCTKISTSELSICIKIQQESAAWLFIKAEPPALEFPLIYNFFST